MVLSQERIKHAIQLKSSYVVSVISEQNKISLSEAYRQFTQTKTYDLLLEEHSKLYTESFEYVLDMYNSELAGDIDNWLAL